jgi:hypothetical protein
VYYPSLNTLVVGKTTTKLTAKADLGKENDKDEPSLHKRRGAN